MALAPLAITLGDPAGVGPELVHKAHAALQAEGSPSAFVIGCAAHLERFGPVARVSDPTEAASVPPHRLPVLDRPLSAPVTMGQPDRRHAPHILGWIKEAVYLCLSGQASGLVTAPISKAPLYAAGFQFPGHTEFLADLTKTAPLFDSEDERTRGPVMMLSCPGLRCVLVTIHEPLSNVSRLITPERFEHTLRVTHHALKTDLGLANPRLSLAGLNPHAGEQGTIGREEIEVLIPVIDRLRAEGMQISGPHPADTLFHAGARETYDAVVCLYHDQALIPVKTLDFWGGVNTSLGLPILRTSPDHGTGFDIAGKGIARADSLVAALKLCHDMALNRAARL